MSNPVHRNRFWRLGVALAAASAFVAFPAGAQAATVQLGTAEAFVVLGGQSVTNTGPSVLTGDLGVAPGTSIVGFGSPAVVNGATHANNEVANTAQADVDTAYGVAASEPVPPGNVLTGTNLGNRTLMAGAYRYASSAQLTGQLTLDAAGDPNAQFVFEIGSTLTTAPGSSVRLVNGASPCNVFWQVGSSATLDTTTAFQGNVMALADISLNNGASVIGRLLARDGSITLINNVLDNSPCVTGNTTPGTTPTDMTPTETTPTDTTPTSTDSATTPTGPTTTTSGSGSGGANDASQPGQVLPLSQLTAAPAATRNGRATMRRRLNDGCRGGFRATVRGRMIKRVVFYLDGKRARTRSRGPFGIYVRAASGQHRLTARVTFTDATRARTLTLRYRGCAAATLRPRRGPSQFTG